ncbi:MAG: DMT family transporter [Syntrophobacter sp.]
MENSSLTLTQRPSVVTLMHRLIGIILIVVSAVGFGTLAILGKYAYADGLDTLTILFFRFSLSALVMFGLLAACNERLPRGLVLFQLIAMGAIGYVGQGFSYLAALKYASPGLVALLLYLYPIFVTILSVAFLRERITGGKVVALGFALAGTALTVGPEGGHPGGILLGILAAVIYSLYIIVGAHVLRRVSAIQSSAVILSSAGVMSGMLMLANGPKLPATGTGWTVIAGIVLFATVLPVMCFLAGLKHIGPTNAAMLSTLEPVVTVLLAMMLLGETLKPITMLGGGLILLAVLLLTRSELRRARSPGNQV